MIFWLTLVGALILLAFVVTVFGTGFFLGAWIGSWGENEEDDLTTEGNKVE